MTKQARAVLEVKHREREQAKADRGRRALKAVLSTDQGKEACWYLLSITNLFAPELWSSSAEIHKNTAVRDFGMRLMTLMVNADENAIFEIQRRLHHEAVEERLEDEKLLREQED